MAKAKKPRKIRKAKADGDLSAELDAMGPVADYPAGRIAWWRDRVAIIDRHRRRSRLTDVEAAQERHSPTVEIAVDDPEATRKARRNLTRVRQSEVWRHNRLTGMQRQAEIEMELAWRARTAGLGAASQSYGVRIGGTTMQMASVVLEETWIEWTRVAKQKRLRIPVVIDVLSEPRTLAAVERARRLRPGRAFGIYVQGLDLWAELRGWVQGHATIA